MGWRTVARPEAGETFQDKYVLPFFLLNRTCVTHFTCITFLSQFANGSGGLLGEDFGSTEGLDRSKRKQSMYVKNKLQKGTR